MHILFKDISNITIDYTQSGDGSITASSISYKEWKKEDDLEDAERLKLMEQGKPYKYEEIKPGIGLLNIYSFSVGDFGAYEFFLQDIFKEMNENGVHSLIIDVRDNFGGYPRVSAALFHYISETSFKTMGLCQTKISSQYRNYLKDRNINMHSAYHLFGSIYNVDINAIHSGKINTIINKESEYNETAVTREQEFQGDVYLLANRQSFSAASSFASTFQCNNMGIIVGEETGGTKIFRANAITQKLNRSLLRISASTTRLYTSCALEEYESVKPHVESVPSLLDRIHGIDSQLNLTMLLIKKVQRERAAEAEEKK